MLTWPFLAASYGHRSDENCNSCHTISILHRLHAALGEGVLYDMHGRLAGYPL